MLVRDYQENAAAVSHSALLKAWNLYTDLGYRPIPLKGFTAAEYQQAKQPIIKAWQDIDPRKIDTSKLAGIGLVVGAKSRHTALDCDSVQMEFEAYNALSSMGLADTWIVQSASSRQHFHFRIAPDVILPRQSKRAANEYDFLSANGQIVAPPTEWNEYRWITISGSPKSARILSQNQLNEIGEFLADYKLKKGKIEQDETRQQLAAASMGDLCVIFDSLTITMSRNTALFCTSAAAHNNGYSAEQIAAEVLNHFVHCPPSEKTQNRKAESSESRRAEGIATIQSACSGQYRISKPALKLVNVPANHLREKLLQQGKTGALRLLETLYRNGVQAGQVLSHKQIEQTVNEILSQKQCRTALESGIFTITTPKNSEHYNLHYNERQQGLVIVDNAAGNGALQALHTEKAKDNATYYVCRVSKRAKTRNSEGRPVEKLYTIPALSSLYSSFGVVNKGSDELPIEALKSDKAYRIALLRAHVDRSPGRWPIRYFAGLLGVQRRAVQRYIKAAGLIVIPQVDRQKVNRYNAIELVPQNPADFGRLGYWLEDWNGNKHVPSLAHAERLLAYGEIHLCKQLPNYYTTSAASVPPHILASQPKTPKKGQNHE
jgi:hypothetical protein